PGAARTPRRRRGVPRVRGGGSRARRGAPAPDVGWHLACTPRSVMSRGLLLLCLVAAASASGCSALLGVEEVALDEGAGGGGGAGGGDAGGPWALGPFTAEGAASDPPDASTSTGTSAGAGGAPATGGGSTAAGGPSGGGAPAGPTSSASGGGCVQDRPAC